MLDTPSCYIDLMDVPGTQRRKSIDLLDEQSIFLPRRSLTIGEALTDQQQQPFIQQNGGMLFPSTPAGTLEEDNPFARQLLQFQMQYAQQQSEQNIDGDGDCEMGTEQEFEVMDEEETMAMQRALSSRRISIGVVESVFSSGDLSGHRNDISCRSSGEEPVNDQLLDVLAQRFQGWEVEAPPVPQLQVPASSGDAFQRELSLEKHNKKIKAVEEKQLTPPIVNVSMQFDSRRPPEFMDMLRVLVREKHECLNVLDGGHFYVIDPVLLAAVWQQLRNLPKKRNDDGNGVHALFGYYVRRGKLTRFKKTLGARARNVYSFVHKE